MKVRLRLIPSNGPLREALRKKGQFWTPEWVAEAMVSYLTSGGSVEIFDPAVGEGAFFRAAREVEKEIGRIITLSGTEIDQSALQKAKLSGLSDADLINVQITDFVQFPPRELKRSIVANPPYIRHHRLSTQQKDNLKVISQNLIGRTLDGRAGLHIYFLLRALQILDKGGRLAFIMPADTCEGVFSIHLWNWITKNFKLEAVITFAPEASPFPGVDTNAIIFLIKNDKPSDFFKWIKCLKAGSSSLKEYLLSDFNNSSFEDLEIHLRSISEGLTTGLSRAPQQNRENGPVLGDFVSVLRGVATGANSFFFLTRSKATSLGISEEFLLPAVGRVRDIRTNEFKLSDLIHLENIGRPTLLLSPDGRPLDNFPEAVQKYLLRGEDMGINKKTLISSRHPWYKMESRSVPPLLFAYLGRRNTRFIRNCAGVIPLTGFLCVYPKNNDPDQLRRLWVLLQDPDVIANLALVGKSYGDGAIKVEPRALERLPLPQKALEKFGLISFINEQLVLC